MALVDPIATEATERKLADLFGEIALVKKHLENQRKWRTLNDESIKLKNRVISLFPLAERLREKLPAFLDEQTRENHFFQLQKLIKIGNKVLDFLETQSRLSWFAEYILREVRSQTMLRLHDIVTGCEKDLTAAFTLENRFVASLTEKYQPQEKHMTVDRVAASQLVSSEAPKLGCEISNVTWLHSPAPGPLLDDEEHSGESDIAPLQRARTLSLEQHREQLDATDLKIFCIAVELVARHLREKTMARRPPGSIPHGLLAIRDMLQCVGAGVEDLGLSALDLQEFCSAITLVNDYGKQEQRPSSVEDALRKAALRLAGVLQRQLVFHDQSHIFIRIDSLAPAQRWIPESELTFGEPLGQGGMSVVRHAKYKKPEADGSFTFIDVAVKLPKNYSDGENFRIIREYLLLRDACSEYVVQVYGLCRIKRKVGLVMELMKPPYDIQKLLAKEKKPSTPVAKSSPSARERLGMMLQIARAFEYLHWVGLVHCDPKALNCLITQSNRVVLTDFGLSKEDGESTRGGRGQCTPAWASQEIRNGETHTFASDIWALGVTFWEILTGDSPLAHYKLLISPTVTPLYPFPPGTPTAISELILSCWRWDPKDRPTARELVQRLQEIYDEPRWQYYEDYCLQVTHDNARVTSIGPVKGYPVVYARNQYHDGMKASWQVTVLGLPTHGGLMIGIARPPRLSSPAASSASLSSSAAAAGAADVAAAGPADDASGHIVIPGYSFTNPAVLINALEASSPEWWMLTWSGGLYHRLPVRASTPDSLGGYQHQLCGTTFSLSEGCTVRFKLNLVKRTLKAGIGGRPMRVLFTEVTGPVSPAVCLYHAGCAVEIAAPPQSSNVSPAL